MKKSAGTYTFALDGTDQYQLVSIHAPGGGATGQVPSRELILWCFNPRARGGRDFKLQWRG